LNEMYDAYIRLATKHIVRYSMVFWHIVSGLALLVAVMLICDLILVAVAILLSCIFRLRLDIHHHSSHTHTIHLVYK